MNRLDMEVSNVLVDYSSHSYFELDTKIQPPIAKMLKAVIDSSRKPRCNCSSSATVAPNAWYRLDQHRTLAFCLVDLIISRFSAEL